MMGKLTFDHIHLFTRDPEATATFYERMFGAEVIRSTQEGRPRIDLKLGGANIFILDVSTNPKADAGPAHPHQGLDHFGLQVKNIDAVCAELKSKGAMFSRGPQRSIARCRGADTRAVPEGVGGIGFRARAQRRNRVSLR
jgi:lactoylglutathione lyase